MAGNKNSGRRGGLTKANAEYRLETIDEAWRLIRANLNNEEIPLAQRLDIATKLAVKSVPTELVGGFTANVQAMGTIEKVVDGVKTVATYNIGSVADSDEQADPPPNS